MEARKSIGTQLFVCSAILLTIVVWRGMHWHQPATGMTDTTVILSVITALYTVWLSVLLVRFGVAK